MNCEEIDKMGPGLQGGARRIPALLGVIFIYEVGAAAAMARSDADRELQCVPVDLDSVPTASLSLDAWTLAIGVLLVLSVRRHARAEVDSARRRCCVVSVLADDDAKGIKDGKMMVMMVK